MLCGANALLAAPSKKVEIKKVNETAKVTTSLAGSNATHKVVSMTYAEFGPFEDHVAACKYCFGSHTRTSVVTNCICTAYTGSDGPTAFCTASKPGVAYSSGKDGACKCIEKDMANMGRTTCVPWDQ